MDIWSLSRVGSLRTYILCSCNNKSNARQLQEGDISHCLPLQCLKSRTSSQKTWCASKCNEGPARHSLGITGPHFCKLGRNAPSLVIMWIWDQLNATSSSISRSLSVGCLFFSVQPMQCLVSAEFGLWFPWQRYKPQSIRFCKARKTRAGRAKEICKKQGIRLSTSIFRGSNNGKLNMQTLWWYCLFLFFSLFISLLLVGVWLWSQWNSPMHLDFPISHSCHCVFGCCVCLHYACLVTFLGQYRINGKRMYLSLKRGLWSL